jgi:hypothetical protein
MESCRHLSSGLAALSAALVIAAFSAWPALAAGSVLTPSPETVQVGETIGLSFTGFKPCSAKQSLTVQWDKKPLAVAHVVAGPVGSDSFTADAIVPSTPYGLTVRTFLLGSGPEDDTARIGQLLSEHDVVSRCGGALTRLTQQGREAADEQLASVTAGLLDLDLGDLLIYGWRTHERLVKAARQTRRIPGRQEVVQLGTHRITSAHNPTIELLIDGVKVHTFRFQLAVTFGIEVAALIIRDGLVTGLKAGDSAVTCTLTLEVPGGDVELVNQQRKINLHLIINIGHGIPLLRADDADVARPVSAAV